MAHEEETSPLPPKEEKNHTQNNVVTLLYYSRAVYLTVLLSLGSSVVSQATINETIDQAIKQLLDYCPTHPYSTIIYNKSGMLLHVHIDVS